MDASTTGKPLADLSSASENGREHARQWLASLPKGAVILADLGSGAFRWFDDVTEQGHRGISRCNEGTTVVVLHTAVEAGDTGDRLVWLGADDWKATAVVRQVRFRQVRFRQVRFRQGGVLRHDLTTVWHPLILPLPEIARLSARRWDLELAFLTLKRELGLHLIWRSNALVVPAHVWAGVLLAHVRQALRRDVALRAEVDAFDVSLPLLFEGRAQWSWDRGDGIEEGVRPGRRLGLIRPSTRLHVPASPLPPEHVIPLPQGPLRCRQPFSGKPKHPEPACDKAVLPSDPARDRVVAWLFPREAELLALTRLTRSPSGTASQPASLHRLGKPTRPRTAAMPAKPFVPDPSIVAPSQAFPQPFLGLA